MRTSLTCALLLAGSALGAPIPVHLTANLPSPQLVGTTIGLFAWAAGPPTTPFNYRFSVSVDRGPFHMVRDFNQSGAFLWMPDLFEHDAKIRVSVRNNKTKETGEAEILFRIDSRVRGGDTVVTPTVNPLIALFSAPACEEGGQFQVEFRKAGESKASHTPPQDCHKNRTNNVLIAGMTADTQYELRSKVSGNQTSTWMPFHTGLLDGFFPPVKVVHPRQDNDPDPDPLTVYSIVDQFPWRPMATDEDGNVVWYFRHPAFLTRMLPGGHFLLLRDGENSSNSMKRLQLLQEIDLGSNVLRETNMTRVAEQLDKYGIKSDCKEGAQECVSGFHHEAIRTPNGHTLVIAGYEKMFPAGTQGAKERVDILGDLVIDLDEDFQVAWVWNGFDHMDLKRASLGDEKCQGGPGDDGCPPVFLAKAANGWLHSNSLQYERNSGDLLLSIPEQDWVVKIDYKNGKGSGKILWRLGTDGDFKTDASDPYPWFSYQHDVGFEPAGSDALSLIDDGRQRKKKFPNGNNRGQVWKLNEDAKTATLVQNADLGVYSFAVGSAQLLPDGHASYESGIILGPGGIRGQMTEVDRDGKVAYAQEIDGTVVYRSFRVPDLYTAPSK